MQLKGYEIKELPDKGVLYLKKWQGNGFYPLEKAEKTDKGWRLYSKKVYGWKLILATYTDTLFLYMLRNNDYLITDYPMTNEDDFNFE